MKTINLPLMKRLFIVLALAFCSITLAQAQTNNAAICDEGDCPPALFSIHLEEPLLPSPPGSFSSQRTANFKDAYLKF